MLGHGGAGLSARGATAHRPRPGLPARRPPGAAGRTDRTPGAASELAVALRPWTGTRPHRPGRGTPPCAAGRRRPGRPDGLPPAAGTGARQAAGRRGRVVTAGTGGDDLRRLASAARPVRGRLGAAVAAGTGAMLASIGLTATAAWLIARASERPPVLALGVAVVAVRFFGVARPVLRYAERLLSHDGALRAGRPARGGLRPAHPPDAGAAGRDGAGDLLARVVSDVDAGAGPAAAGGPRPGRGRGAGLRRLRRPGRRRAPVLGDGPGRHVRPRGWSPPSSPRTVSRCHAPPRPSPPGGPRWLRRWSSLVDGAPDLIAMGAAPASLREIERLDTQATAAARRVAWCAGLGAGLASLAAGAAVLGSAVVGTSAVRSGALPGTVLAVLVLVPLTAFESLAALPPAAVLLTTCAPPRAGSSRCWTPNRRCRAAHPLPPPAPPYGLDLRASAPAGPATCHRCSTACPSPSHRAAASRSWASRLGQVHTRRPDAAVSVAEGDGLLGGRELGGLASDDVHRVVGLVADDAHVFASTLRANLALPVRRRGRRARRRAAPGAPGGWTTPCRGPRHRPGRGGVRPRR